LLTLERKQYLGRLQDVIAGRDVARVVLVGALECIGRARCRDWEFLLESAGLGATLTGCAEAPGAQ
jgi:hypothetical protein